MGNIRLWPIKVLYDWLTKEPYYPFVNAEGSIYFGSDGTKQSIKAALDAIKTRLKNIEVGETEVDDKTIEYNALRQLQVKKGSLTGEYVEDESIGKEKLSDIRIEDVDGVPVLFWGSNQYKLEKFRTAISTIFSDPQFTSFSYTSEAAATAGATVSPSIAYKVKKTITYNDGSTDVSYPTSGGVLSFVKTSGASDASVDSNGKVKFANANTSTTDKKSAVITATLSFGTGTSIVTATKDATARQKAATVLDYVYMGFIPTSISGFSEEYHQNSLPSNVTAAMIDQAIAGGHIAKNTSLPISTTTVTGDKEYFYVMACPIDQTNQYKLQVYDAFAAVWMPLEDFWLDGHATDGGITRTLSDGKTYKIYGFCAGQYNYTLQVIK